MEKIYKDTDEIRKDIRDNMKADTVYGRNDTYTDVYFHGKYLGRIRGKEKIKIRLEKEAAEEKQTIDNFDYTGNESFTRRDSVLHYYLGRGQEVTVNFDHFDNGIEPDGFRDYKKLVDSMQGKTGTLDVDEEQVQTIGGWAGQVTFTLNGTITSIPDEWKFSGFIETKNDIFNFDEKDKGERTEWAETITWFMREKMPEGEPYKIVFKGNRKVTGSGKWPDHPINLEY